MPNNMAIKRHTIAEARGHRHKEYHKNSFVGNSHEATSVTSCGKCLSWTSPSRPITSRVLPFYTCMCSPRIIADWAPTGLVANPVLPWGQLNRETSFPWPHSRPRIRSRETVLMSRANPLTHYPHPGWISRLLADSAHSFRFPRQCDRTVWQTDSVTHSVTDSVTHSVTHTLNTKHRQPPSGQSRLYADGVHRREPAGTESVVLKAARVTDDDDAK